MAWLRDLIAALHRLISKTPVTDEIDVELTGEGYRLVQVGHPVLHPGHCEDCGSMRCYVSWWCENREAHKARGTTLPGVADCRFWTSPPPKGSL